MILISDFFQCSTTYLASLIQQYCLYREWRRHLDELYRTEKPPANNRANFEASSAFSRVYERALLSHAGRTFQSYIRVYTGTSFFPSIIHAIDMGTCDNARFMLVSRIGSPPWYGSELLSSGTTLTFISVVRPVQHAPTYTETDALPSLFNDTTSA